MRDVEDDVGNHEHRTDNPCRFKRPVAFDGCVIPAEKFQHFDGPLFRQLVADNVDEIGPHEHPSQPWKQGGDVTLPTGLD